MLVSMIFVLLRISPGDPAQKYISPELNSHLAQEVRSSFGLDGSLFEQYKSFLVNIVSGNFGISYNYRLPVLSVIMNYLPFTVIFASIVLFVQIVGGYFLARVSFGNINPKIDQMLSNFVLLFFSLPSFVIALILIYIFSVHLGVLPIAGIHSIGFEEMSIFNKIIDRISHLILPVITLSFYGVVIFYKYLRDNFDSVSNKMFIHYLEANGINKKEIKKHIIKNSLGTLVSVAGVEFSVLLGGTLITEVIFSLPGMGFLTVNAILMRDYPLIVGCVFFSGILVLLVNFIADIVRALLDKRLVKEIL